MIAIASVASTGWKSLSEWLVVFMGGVGTENGSCGFVRVFMGLRWLIIAVYEQLTNGKLIISQRSSELPL